MSEERLLRGRVRLAARLESADHKSVGDVTSLSVGGAFIVGAELEPEGTLARLEIELDGPDPRLVRATVEVLYRGFEGGLAGMGLRFVRLAPGDRDAIVRRLAGSRAPHAAPPARRRSPDA